VPVKEGNVVLIIPADIEQALDVQHLREQDARLAPLLGYSLASLLTAMRPAS
jgi:hypothetical protein